MTVRYLVGDVRKHLAEMPDGSVDLVMTSPPFLGLRSYLPADHPDKRCEIGSEPTPAAFLDTMLDLTEEWGRVLAPHGSICVEFGDTYAGSGGAGGDYNEGGLRDGQERFDGSAARARTVAESHRGADLKNLGNTSRGNLGRMRENPDAWPLDKSLCCIPGLYEASLAYGRNLLNPTHTIEPWRVRNFVAWVRPNPPVGALGDKVRPATSYLTWATRARDRWFDLDAVRTPVVPEKVATRAGTKLDSDGGNRWSMDTYTSDMSAGAPPLDWWKIVPGGYSGAHYAVYPVELCRIPIEASCPRRVCTACGTPSRRVVDVAYEPHGDAGRQNAERWATAGNGVYGGAQSMANGRADKLTTTTGWTTCGCPGTDGLRLDGWHTGGGWRPGLVLDPFGGSGTTGVAALGLSRDCVLIDIDERNADLARERLGMFLEVEERRTDDVVTGGLL